MATLINYQRRAAIAYADKWALKRNPAYYDFHAIGGDCTNFISQCLYAGAGVMNYTPVTGWYYNSLSDRTASFTGVEFLYRFLVGNAQTGPYASEIGLERILPGDVIQLGREDGGFYHSLFVLQTGEMPTRENTLVATHTLDAWMRPLNSYVIRRMRCLRIEGVRS